MLPLCKQRLVIALTCLVESKYFLFIVASNECRTRGQVIAPAGYEGLVRIGTEPVSATNAGYDQPPPAYDSVADSNTETVGEPLDIPTTAPPSYYDLYKDGEVKTEEEETTGNDSEQLIRSDAQESAATTRNS